MDDGVLWRKVLTFGDGDEFTFEVERYERHDGAYILYAVVVSCGDECNRIVATFLDDGDAAIERAVLLAQKDKHEIRAAFADGVPIHWLPEE